MLLPLVFLYLQNFLCINSRGGEVKKGEVREEAEKFLLLPCIISQNCVWISKIGSKLVFRNWSYVWAVWHALFKQHLWNTYKVTTVAYLKKIPFCTESFLSNRKQKMAMCPPSHTFSVVSLITFCLVSSCKSFSPQLFWDPICCSFYFICV